jgi:prepilin-type N-terminal cleavage/methylation domain-containing protein
MGRVAFRSPGARPGFTLIELLVAMVAIAVLTPFLMKPLQRYYTGQSQKLAATHLAQVADGARRYIAANYTALVTAATGTTAATFTVADMRAGGFLPSGFQGTNNWGQAYTVYVLEPTANELLGLVLTSGGRGHDANMPEFANVIVPGAATQVGAAGGFVPVGGVGGQVNDVVQGVGGGWSFAFAGTNIPNPGPGHLAANLFFGDSRGTDDYLYRVSVPGHPEYNQMSTGVDFNDNPIEQVEYIDFVAHDTASYACDGTAATEGRLLFNNSGMYVCRGGEWRLLQDSDTSALIQDVSIVANQALIPHPICPSDHPTPQIFVTPVAGIADNSGRYIKGWETLANIVGGNQWQVLVRLHTDVGWMTPGADFARLQIITKCS